MSLRTLALIGICGLCGPLLSASTRGATPAAADVVASAGYSVRAESAGRGPSRWGAPS
jgi:hypothetical protein